MTRYSESTFPKGPAELGPIVDVTVDPNGRATTADCSGSGLTAAQRADTPAIPFTPGTAIQGGRYDLLRLIGKGGMGWVFEARDQRRGQSVALKIMRAPRPADDFRLKREFRALADLRHPNLVRMHELGREGNTLFLTMELVDGVDFQSYVRPPPHRQLDRERLRAALAQLVCGVQALHAAGKLHRDLKPSNVLVDGTGRVVVLDFGLIHETHTHLFAPDTERAGTPGFMAPEQERGLPAGTASDWYSVGAILHEALADAPLGPHLDTRGAAAETARGALASDEADLVDLAVALLDPVPERRPSGAAVAARLRLPARDPAPARLQTIDGLVGRASQVEQLHECLRRAQSGQPTRVLITGPSGIGKTALVSAFLESAVRDGALALAGKCHERDTVPYKALDTIVDELSRYLQHLPADELAELITADLSALLQVFPVLGRVPALRAYESAVERRSDPVDLRTRALSALKALLRRIGERRTLLLFIDDLQWGDLDSARLLTRLMAPPDPPQLLLLAAYRSAGGDRGEAVDWLLHGSALPGDPARTEQLVLDALTQEQARELLARLLAAHDVPEATCDQLASESTGNPLFATELALSWLGRAGGVPSGDEPLSLAALLGKRIARLPESAAELLQLMVVASRPPSIEVLGQALSGAGDALWPSLDLLKLERFVHAQVAEGRESIALCHDRIRETVDAGLDGARRARLHRQLADAIGAVTPGEHEALLDHLLGAGATAQAGECAARAGDAASSVLAFDRAAQFYRQALDLLAPARSDELGVRRKLGDALAAVARCNEAAAVYLELSARTRDTRERAELLRCAAVQALAGGDGATGVRAFAQLFGELGLRWPGSSDPSKLERTGHVLKLLLLCELALSRFRPVASNEREERLAALMAAAESVIYYDRGSAYRLIMQFVSRALLGGGPAMRAHACVTLAGAWIASRGVTPRAFRLLERASELARQGGDPHALASSQNSLSVARMIPGGFADGEALAISAEELTRSLPAGRITHKFARQLLISSQFWQGKLLAANRGLELMLTDARERGHTFDRLGDDPVEAERRLCIRQSLQAEPLLRHADCMITFGPGFRWESWFDLLAALYRGDLARAAEVEQGLRRDALWNRLARFQQLYASGLVALATAARESGRNRKQRSIAQRAVRDLERMKVVPATACGALLRAGLAALDGDVARVRASLARAAERFFACGMQLHAHCSRRALGCVTEGAAAAALIADADAFMREQSMVDCERWTYCHVPAYERIRTLRPRAR